MGVAVGNVAMSDKEIYVNTQVPHVPLLQIFASFLDVGLLHAFALLKLISAAAVQMSINFLVSLLKKNWQNVKCLYLKTTMGQPYRLF